MKVFSEKTRAAILLLPSVLLFIWFRFEEFFHSHLPLLVVWLVLATVVFYLLYRTIQWKGRVAILSLWFLICALVAVDFWQLVSYRDYSDASFREKVDQSTASVKKRAESLLQKARDHEDEVETAFHGINPLTMENLFLSLPAKLPASRYSWGIYDQDGQLLCWSGQVPYHEGKAALAEEEVSVYSQLHQQFLRFRKTIKLGRNIFSIEVLDPVSADYGIENRYLKTYNLLTDGLSLRPDLLYNSQQSSTSSPDLVIRNVAITPDFSISTLYRKAHYDEFLIHRIFQLHWWLELTGLCFVLITIIFLFFQFLGIAAEGPSYSKLLLKWAIFFAACLFSDLTILHFRAFGAETLFRPNGIAATGWQLPFRSAGSLVFTAFFVLNLVLATGVLLRALHREIRWRSIVFNYGLFFLVLVLSGILFIGYYEFVRNTLLFSPFDPIDFSLLQMDPVKLAQVFGMLWLDLAFVLLIVLLYAVVMKNLRRTAEGYALFFAMQLLVLAGFYLIYRNTSVPLIPSFLLYFGLGLLVFVYPLWSDWFGRINLLSRFLIVLVTISLLSFLFHVTRFHYATDLQKSVVENEAASQVRDQNQTLRSLITISQHQLDDAVENLSVEPRISDLAYRLWTRTDFARLGYKSAVEIYDNDGNLVNRFALDVPKLSLDVQRDTGSEQWTMHERTASFGNFRKSVLIGSRQLRDVGFLVVEAVEDYENIPFVSTSSPFQELFRPMTDPRLSIGPPNLNIYDVAWHPVYVSNPELSPPVQQARSALRNATSAWSHLAWNGQRYLIYFFRTDTGFAALITPTISMRTHLVHLIDLFLFNFVWLFPFALVSILLFRRYTLPHFRGSSASTRFNFFQRLLFAFLVFSMIPMLFLSLFIRNYVEQKKIDEVTSRALHSFSVASKVVSDYLFYRAGEQDTMRGQLFSNELLEWISQVIQQDVSFYYDRYLQAASDREFYSAGLLSEQIPGNTYLDLFYKGQKYSISEMQVGRLKFLNVSGRMYTGRFKDEVITIPFLIDQKSVEAEIIGLREYMLLVGAGLILFAVLLGYFLASRFSRPVQVLIHGTGEMSRGNLQYRIRESYQDEFQKLVDSFNAMAASLNENQEALERRRAYIENILNNITTAVISIDSTMHITMINPAAAGMFGIEEYYRGSFEPSSLFQGERARVEEAVQRFLKRREEFQMMEVGLLGTNTETHLRLVWVPLFEENHWNGAILLVEDISDIIRSNKLSAWAEMARQVAHEVKNPLTPIQLAIEHLVKVYDDRSENFEAVLRNCSDAVLKQVKALRRLVSEFSQFGRPAILNRSEVNLKDFLQELIGSYKKHLPEGISMDTSLDPQLPVTRIDPEKLRGALMNIIENGLQAMNGHGKMTVEARNGSDHYVTIRIRDTGQGIPPEILPRLFEPYFSTKTGGTGLGLAIARKNVEDHGGKIQVESQPNRGTTVTVLLPTPTEK